MDSNPPPDVSNYFIALLFLAATLIILSLLFSASESAFLALNKLRVHYLREKGDKRAIRAGKLLEKKEELLNMLLVGNELVNVALSVVLTSVALKLFGAAGVGIATAVATVLLLIFGEITPKSVTTRHPESIAFGLSRFVVFFFYLLRPFVIIFTAISRCCLKLLGIDTKNKGVSFTEDEIKTFIDVGREDGVLNNSEKNMMSRVFKFTDLEAQDIMVPRTKIIGVSSSMSWRDIIQLSERTRLSRFPVYEGDFDNIIGILYVKDLLFYKGAKESFKLQNILHKPIFIPGTTKMSAIQALLRDNKQSFAVVMDEYSGTDGILTSEDIAREIFGGIVDDYEQSGKSTSVKQKDFSDTVIDGSSRLRDLEEELHIKLESSINETIAGYICEQLGRMPVSGDSINVSGYEFIVKSMDGRRIAQVQCIRDMQEEDYESDD